MLTKVERFSSETAITAAKILRDGGLVAIPTETVYGLAANALDENAVGAIFAAKGRPQDNPLIVHISDIEMLDPLVTDISDLAKNLARKFWPGPLTMIFNKSEIIPYVTSGGLSTVAVRLPANKAAREIIRHCGFPLAAPSANTSGKPSPTSAAHVLDDMNGKIPLIVDDGECSVGVESTVICFVDGKIRVLRPGGITPRQLSEFAEVVVDKAVTSQPDSNEPVLSPGMKYKHYSPKADVFIVDAHGQKFINYCSERAKNEDNLFVLSAGETKDERFHNYGSTSEEQAQKLFSLLRKADEIGAKTVLVEMPAQDEMGLAVYNRLLRAAAFRIIRL